jgi:hypothetical protein
VPATGGFSPSAVRSKEDSVLLKGRSRLIALLFVVAPFFLLVMAFATGCSSSSDSCDCNPETELDYCSDCFEA